MGGIVRSVMSIFTGGGESAAPSLPPPPPPPTVADPGVQQAERDARTAAAKAKGRASTMLMGTTDEGGTTDGEAKTAKKYLLGS